MLEGVLPLQAFFTLIYSYPMFYQCRTGSA